MADFDMSESPYERLKQEAQKKGEPSSDTIHMSLEGHRRPVVPSRRFPSQQTPIEPEPQVEPVVPVSAEPAQSHDDQVPAQDLEAELDAEHEANDAADSEAAEIADHDAQDHQRHVEAAEHERLEDDHQEEVRAEEREHLDREVRDTSGSSAGTSGGTGSGAAATASAPEAHPQRDEPDDGQHTESAPAPIEEPQSAQPEPEAAPAPDPVTPEPLLDPPSQTEPPAVVTASASRTQPLGEGDKPWQSAQGSQRMDYDDKVFFKHDEEMTIMKKISRPMIDQLRVRVASVTGGEFAEKISGAALLTAFIAVKLGYPMEVDENTAKAMSAFEMMEPRLDAIEEHAAEISRDIVMMGDVMTQMNKKMLTMDRAMRSMELVQAYAFTDRVLGGIDGADDTAESIRLNAPKAQHTLVTLRREAEAMLKVEREREGRAISRGQ